MSDRHAVIFADEIGLHEALPLQDDEFICDGCNLVAHEARLRVTESLLNLCDTCYEDRGY